MTSVIFKAFHQIKETGKVKLFKSYLPKYPDGGQLRDFVYVKDCIDVMWWLFKNPDVNGIFNLGTGRARTWNDLIKAVFSAMKKIQISNISRCPKLCAINISISPRQRWISSKPRAVPCKFSSLEDSVRDYVVNYLQKADPYLGN